MKEDMKEDPFVEGKGCWQHKPQNLFLQVKGSKRLPTTIEIIHMNAYKTSGKKLISNSLQTNHYLGG